MTEVFIQPDAVHALQGSSAHVVVLAVWSDETHAAAVLPLAQRPCVPGALATELASDFAAPGGGMRGSRPLPALDILQEKARNWGIRHDSIVVVYDHDRALQAARAWWVLRWAGVGRVLILDGGFDAWARAGLPVRTGAARCADVPGDVQLSAGHMPQLDEDAAAALARTGMLLDTRIAPNYRGGPTGPDEAPRGHIPGAVSLPAPDNLDANGRFLSPEQLRERFATAGYVPERPVGVYCGAGVSAAHTIAALLSLGILAPMYVGSWSAWSADASRLVARGPEPG